jgi:hypothetical protein
VGAWGVGAFENDAALDWAAELEDTRDWAPVREALALTAASDRVVDGEDPEASVAAAAVVALGIDRSLVESVELPEGVGPFLDEADPPPADLVALAVASLDCILRPDGDLRARWDSDGAAAWEADITRWRGALRVENGR